MEREREALWEAIYELRYQVSGLQALYLRGAEIDHRGREAYLLTNVAALPEGEEREIAIRVYKRLGWITEKAAKLLSESGTESSCKGGSD